MEKKNVVLIGIPTYSAADYCFTEFAEQLRAVQYPLTDILFCDNSPDEDHYDKRIREAGFNCIHIRRKNKSQTAILAEAHETLRQQALARPYITHLLHWESDIFVPNPQTIVQHLLAAKREVIGGYYHIDHGEHSRLMLMVQDSPTEYLKLVRDVRKDAVTFLNGDIKRVHSCGLGLVLIARQVLEKIKFRHEEGQHYFPDTFFYNDLNKAGVNVYCDTSLLCEHRNEVDKSFIKA